MQKIWLLYIVFLFSSISVFGQKSYSKTILGEEYNSVGTNRIISCQNEKNSVFSFIPIRDNNSGSLNYPKQIIAIKHDSLGDLKSKKYLQFNSLVRVVESICIDNKVFVLLNISPHLGQINPNKNLVIIKLDSNLNILKSVRISRTEFALSPNSELIEGKNKSLVFATTAYKNQNLGEALLINISNDLNSVQALSLADQYVYTVPGYYKDNFHWFTNDGHYLLDNNFNTLATNKLEVYNSSYSVINQFSADEKGIILSASNRVTGTIFQSIRFDEKLNQEKILFSDSGYFSPLISGQYSNQYFKAYLDDYSKVDVFTIDEENGYTLKQTINLPSSSLAITKPQNISFNQILLHYISPEDNSIHFIKGIDTIPSQTCLEISFPPDTIYDTGNSLYSFIPHNTPPPSLTSVNNLLVSAYNVMSIDSLNSSNDTLLPMVEIRCRDKFCFIATPPPIGGLFCNIDSVLLSIERLNPFNLDTSLFPSRVLWNWSIEQDSYLVVRPDSQVITVSIENYFCHQFHQITVHFDSVNVNTVIDGELCLDSPSSVELFVTGDFETIQWENTVFQDTTYQITQTPGVFPFYVESRKGCRIDTLATVNESCPPKIYIPNAFTPNGDGRNDSFVGYADFLDEFIFMVYDRWGKVIFSTSTSPIIWDGTYKGTSVQIGLYNWRISYNTTHNGKVIVDEQFGHISIIK
jgi:gliding motility-associated-like protein